MQEKQSHPGLVLSEFLQATNKSVQEIADSINLDKETLNKIIGCKERINPAIALKLATAFGSSPDFWNSIQSSYDLLLAKRTTDISDIKRFDVPSSTVSNIISKFPSYQEDSLFEAEYLLEAFIEESTVATAIFIGPGLKIKYANNIMIGYWGKDKSILGKPLGEAVPELKGQTFLELLDKVYSTGNPYVGTEEKVFLTVNGSLNSFYFNYTYKALRTATGQTYAIYHTATDVTEQVLTKIALTESKERFQGAIAAIEGILWTNNAEGKMEGEQPGWAELTGQTQEEYQGYGWAQAIHPEDARRSVEAWEEAVKKRKTFIFEHRIKLKDGSWGIFSVRAIPLVNPDGSVREWVGVHTNITERRLIEQALRESEERFRKLADQIPQFIWMSAEDGLSTIYANKTYLDFLGLSHYDEFTGKAWEKFIYEQDIPLIYKTYDHAFANKQSYILECRLKEHATAQYKWFLMKGVPRFGADGKFNGFIGTGVDINEQKIAHEQLEEKNSLLLRINNDLDNFIYTASHDLKAPISNIEGLINALSKSFDQNIQSNPKAQTFISLIYKSIDRFKSTIADLTEVAKLQNIEEDSAEIMFIEVLEEVRLSIRPLIEESDAIITYDFSEAPSLYISKKNIRSILYNLISNAIKYRSPERRININISSAQEANFVQLVIQDNGLGIKEEDKPKIFYMFKRLHNHVEGTGVGLSIVKKIIDNNGGRIEIDSIVGEGTSFKIYFKS